VNAPGFATASIITNAKTPWEVVADSVGSDILGGRQSYPLNFTRLEETDTQPNAPFPNGYSTRYSEILACSATQSHSHENDSSPPVPDTIRPSFSGRAC
jgi:hypothetical protein